MDCGLQSHRPGSLPSRHLASTRYIPLIHHRADCKFQHDLQLRTLTLAGPKWTWSRPLPHRLPFDGPVDLWHVGIIFGCGYARYRLRDLEWRKQLLVSNIPMTRYTLTNPTVAAAWYLWRFGASGPNGVACLMASQPRQTSHHSKWQDVSLIAFVSCTELIQPSLHLHAVLLHTQFRSLPRPEVSILLQVDICLHHHARRPHLVDDQQQGGLLYDTRPDRTS